MIRKPLVIIDGRVQELPNSDVLAGGLSEGDEIVYSKRIDFISDNEMYKGEAAVGSLESASVWRIRRVTIANDSDIVETWAGGNANFDKTWANRLSFSYS